MRWIRSVGEGHACRPTAPRAHGRLTTGCSGRSATRPAAEPERWDTCQREHFKPGARKGRGVVHLIGWAASWNTILSPKLTMSTFGFAGFTRCSGGAFSYDPIAP